MSQRTSTQFMSNNNSNNGNDGGRSARIQMDAGDEKIGQMTSKIFNPKNLKLYQIAFVIIFILYIWLSEFSNVALIIKSLLIVTLIAIMVIESIVILSYIE